MDYEINYSRRKTVSLCIKDGRLIVKAPIGFPRSKIESLVHSHSEWIEKNIEKEKQKADKLASLTKDDITRLKKEAKMILPEKVKAFAEMMGLNYGRITITSAKTRFGSCSSKKNLSFSYLLMLYPNEAIDYVVVHELAHLVHMNHSPAFYKVIESVMPDYKERRKLLRHHNYKEG